MRGSTPPSVSTVTADQWRLHQDIWNAKGA